jgi:hypothetical protein
MCARPASSPDRFCNEAADIAAVVFMMMAELVLRLLHLRLRNWRLWTDNYTRGRVCALSRANDGSIPA